MIRPLTLNTGRKIGPGFPTYIIAEVGSNHDGSLEKALKLITLAKKAGADAVKFQSFQAHTLTNFYTKSQNSWVKEPSFEILEKLTVPKEWHKELSNHAKNEKIDFLSTPFDLERLSLLNDLDIPLIKIASGDLTNKELLIAAGLLKKPIVISTGAALIGEVERAIMTLQGAGANEIAVLQCVSAYPATFQDANIYAMKTMQITFQVPVGYSDHTDGIVVPLGSVALGASIIEKHFTDDTSLQGPDHGHSLNPDDFKTLVQSIRDLELALGNGIKLPTQDEIHERIMARRGLYASKPLQAGTVITKDMIKTVRHAFPEGVLAADAHLLLGATLTKEMNEHEIFTWDKLKK